MSKKIMTKVVSTKKQLRLLVHLLQQNPVIAKGLCSKQNVQKKFEEFAIELNKMGPPEREWQKWLRVWTDLKCKVKKRLNENEGKQEQGGPPFINPKRPYSELEEAVIEILQMNPKSAVLPPTQKIDFDDSRISNNSSEDVKFASEDFDEQMLKYASNDSLESLEENYTTATTIKTEPDSPKNLRLVASPLLKDDYQKILEDQVAAQKQFYEKMTDLMCDIRRSMNNVEDYMRKTVKQKETLLELKRDKLRAYKATKLNQRLDMKTKLKIKSELVEIKRKKQEALSGNGI